jgi:hypothetical protein
MLVGECRGGDYPAAQARPASVKANAAGMNPQPQSIKFNPRLRTRPASVKANAAGISPEPETINLDPRL